MRTGPYRFVRHPAYVGMIVAHAGFVALFANPASVVALVLMVAAIVGRIRVEERTLLTIPGYAHYAEGRPRILPAVW